MTLVLFAFAGWCAFDGTVTYPRQIKMYDTFVKLQNDNKEGEWPAIAKSNGWPTDKPEARAEKDILTQWIMMGIMIVLGSMSGLLIITHRGKTLEAEEDFFKASDGTKVNYEDITKIDRKKWNSKGIVYVHFKPDSEGEDDFVKLDDWVFRDADLILKEIDHNRPDLKDDLPGSD